MKSEDDSNGLLTQNSQEDQVSIARKASHQDSTIICMSIKEDRGRSRKINTGVLTETSLGT